VKNRQGDTSDYLVIAATLAAAPLCRTFRKTQMIASSSGMFPLRASRFLEPDFRTTIVKYAADLYGRFVNTTPAGRIYLRLLLRKGSRHNY
jgi:hypothetical protein